MFKAIKNWWIRRQLVDQLKKSVEAVKAKNVPAYLDAQLAFWDLLPSYKGADSIRFFGAGVKLREIAEVELAPYAVHPWLVKA